MPVRVLMVFPEGLGIHEEIDENLIPDIIGGFLEAIHDPNGKWHAYLDEEGKIKGLDVNPVATLVARRAGWLVPDLLCGPVMFLGTDRAPEEADVPQSVIDIYNQIVGR